jgi:hypothetical protein
MRNVYRVAHEKCHMAMAINASLAKNTIQTFIFFPNAFFQSKLNFFWPDLNLKKKI